MSELDLLKKALRLYAGENVLQRVVATGEQALATGGEVLAATVMFTDITRLQPSADRCEPDAVDAALARYFSILVDATASHGGAFDGPIGGAGICWWTGDDHAVSACRCALDVVAVLAAESASPRVIAKIGISSGHVLEGNAGCAERLRYTVTGMVVNFSSRLAGMAPTDDGLPVLIAEPARRLLGNRFPLQELEAVDVKGYEEPVRLYRLARR